MTATILDGRALAKTLREELRADTQAFIQNNGIAPSLAVVKIAGDPASDRYTRTIRKGCEEIGITFTEHTLPPETTQAMLEETISALSFDRTIHGILLHLPLPPGLDSARAIAQIDPTKDVDGVHPYNAGLLAMGRPGLIPNTPAGGMELLLRNNIPLKGQHATVVGRSVVVGKPMALLLLNEHATVTIAHSRTKDLAAVVRGADIVVAATGKPGLITGDMIKPGAVVVDFGVNVLEDGRVVGDVDFDSVVRVASAITPVPGGTGPVTNVMLLRNVLRAAQQQMARHHH
ncbi:MAG: bifunctional 5,10-methylenetetrahydrofolate dehydrogenase/5,10-methenyltetrahydrofolate cyclohydrolase [Roseiflexus sp.]|jgi:methylenetetrahydrofolate dehydrogenase (NADP+)/methenyltetrahydrofolate cyclohydrolase|nr:bifunctional 5,10-methylenetetrahydrofolate dehydrogenase/5,10-methenyltetrahydrofolate cyclohydrolase [Roseiflexus sp.]MBO9334708.1 bifunctional 5,10-methylenetetrahydrofolate dehydrogenase/5,10-methenyltetrahydrofolate cyclohydrolase [Roseiflexus sp.]MBO9364645.1 bifunctional 5,10-methylenetetrahydrofolate dehydrogenase/5,10-methenyltetrahydrofolate cyclohydrolase [Roseiflexus sp.]MBO9382060.1 bifunctional 5,10-methylenetetrahydrofolate dehydrogenase/5,10-methenyltetrahydrofolate cyclohydro